MIQLAIFKNSLLRRLIGAATGVMKWFRELNGTKIAAIIVTNCFLLSSVCGQGIATLLETQRESKKFQEIYDGFNLPSTAGRVTEAKYFGSKQVVINIQDLHCHPEVQRNVSKILASLDEKYHLRNVYLEGASGRVDASWIPALFKDKKTMNRIVESLVDQGKLSGTDYYALMSGRNDLIIGLEDKELYNKNLKRLVQLLDDQDEIQKILSGLNGNLDQLKKTYYNDRQKKLDRTVSKYNNGKLEPKKFYALLRKYSEQLDVEINGYRDIASYTALLEREKELDYPRVSRELVKFIQLLKNKIPYSVYNSLVQRSNNFADIDKLYVYLGGIVQEYDINLANSFPVLDKFFSYIQASQRMNPLGLVSDEKKLVKELEYRLADNQSERDIVFIQDFSRLLSDYLGNKISADDYDYFAANRDEFTLLWAKYTNNRKLEALAPYMELCDGFYQANLERNNRFLSNIACGTNPADTGTAARANGDSIKETINSLNTADEVKVVVTGGFHTVGLDRLLAKNKISYMVVTPNVTQDTKFAEQVYLTRIKEFGKILHQTFSPPDEIQNPAGFFQEAITAQLVPMRLKEKKSWDNIISFWNDEIFAKEEGLKSSRLEKVKETDTQVFIDFVDGKHQATYHYVYDKGNQTISTVTPGVPAKTSATQSDGDKKKPESKIGRYGKILIIFTMIAALFGKPGNPDDNNGKDEKVFPSEEEETNRVLREAEKLIANLTDRVTHLTKYLAVIGKSKQLLDKDPLSKVFEESERAFQMEMESAEPSADVILISAGNDEMARYYDEHFSGLRGKGGIFRSAKEVPVLSVPDPKGRVGNGGAIGHTLLELNKKLKNEEFLAAHPRLRGKEIKDLRIVLVQAGGFGTRFTPGSSDGSKTLMPVPMLLPNGEQATMMDRVIMNAYGFTQKLKKQEGRKGKGRNGIVVLNGDGLLVTTPKLEDGIALITNPASISESVKTYGLVAFDTVKRKIKTFIEKPSLEELTELVDNKQLENINMEDMNSRQLQANTASFIISHSDTKEYAKHLKAFLDVNRLVAKRVADGDASKIYQIDTSGDYFIPLTTDETTYLMMKLPKNTVQKWTVEDVKALKAGQDITRQTKDGKSVTVTSDMIRFYASVYDIVSHRFPELFATAPDADESFYVDYGSLKDWRNGINNPKEGEKAVGFVTRIKAFILGQSIVDSSAAIFSSRIANRVKVGARAVVIGSLLSEGSIVGDGAVVYNVKGEVRPIANTLVNVAPVKVDGNKLAWAVLYTGRDDNLKGNDSLFIKSVVQRLVDAKLITEAQASDKDYMMKLALWPLQQTEEINFQLVEWMQDPTRAPPAEYIKAPKVSYEYITKNINYDGVRQSKAALNKALDREEGTGSAGGKTKARNKHASSSARQNARAERKLGSDKNTGNTQKIMGALRGKKRVTAEASVASAEVLEEAAIISLLPGVEAAQETAVRIVNGGRAATGVVVKKLRAITKLIKTGTSGWRDEHEGEFNIHNIRRMAEGHARYYDSQVTETDINKKPYMIIGYDPRQDNVRNVKETARVFAAHNIPVKIIVAEPTPTPVLAYLAHSGLLEPGREVFGTVNFTASHNPGKYNGYKPGAGDGGLADDDVANEISRLANEAEDYRSMDYEAAKEQGLITEIDPEDAVRIYTTYLIGKLKDNGMWGRIAQRIKEDPNFKIMVNPMQGTAVKYQQAMLDAMTKEVGRNDFYEMVNTNNKDPEFKDVNGAPNPTLETSIAGFVQRVKDALKKGLKVSGLMTDGDADRFGWVDYDGTTFTSDQVIGLLTAYIGDKKVSDGIDKSKLYVLVTVATSGFAKAIAKNRGFNVIETAVGFKWIIKAIKKLMQEKKDAVIILGGESSAHLGLEDMLSWDDGIMVTWYLLGVSVEKGSLSAYKKELEKQLNEKYVTKEEALEMTEELKTKAKALIDSAKTETGKKQIKQQVKEIAAAKGYRQELVGFDTTDGLKVIFKNGDWFLVRPSGTEPLTRDYNESVIKPEETQDRNDILKSMAMVLLGIEEKQAEAEEVLPESKVDTVEDGAVPAKEMDSTSQSASDIRAAFERLKGFERKMRNFFNVSKEEAMKVDPDFAEISFDGNENRLGWTVSKIKWLLDNYDRLIADTNDPDRHTVLKDAREIRENYDYVIFAGMGGSGLSVQTVKTTFGDKKINIFSLRTTDPAAIDAILKEITAKEGSLKKALEKTLVIPVSKSGTTQETVSHKTYFEDLYAKVGIDDITKHMWVVTHKGSSMDKGNITLRELQLNGRGDIGGRFTAPSTLVFLLPLALVAPEKVKTVLERAKEMNDIQDMENDIFLKLGAFLYANGSTGKDKVTMLVPEEWQGYPGWLEQLIEESLGKEGKGITLFYGEDITSDVLKPAGKNDRVFVRIKVRGKRDRNEKLWNDLKKKGYDIFELEINGIDDIGGVMLGTQRAIASVAYLWDFNFVNQPAVDGYKKVTREVMSQLKPGEKVQVPSEWAYAPLSKENENLKLYYTPLMEAGVLTKTELENEVARLGGDMKNAPAVYAAIINLLSKKPGFEAAEVVSYGVMTPGLKQALEKARYTLYTRGLKMPAKLGEGPDKNHSYHQNVEAGKNMFFSTYFMPLNVQQPEALEFSDNLIKAQTIGTVKSVVKAKRKVVLITAESYNTQTENDVDEFFKQVNRYLGNDENYNQPSQNKPGDSAVKRGTRFGFQGPSVGRIRSALRKVGTFGFVKTAKDGAISAVTSEGQAWLNENAPEMQTYVAIADNIDDIDRAEWAKMKDMKAMGINVAVITATEQEGGKGGLLFVEKANTEGQQPKTLKEKLMGVYVSEKNGIPVMTVYNSLGIGNPALFHENVITVLKRFDQDPVARKKMAKLGVNMDELSTLQFFNMDKTAFDKQKEALDVVADYLPMLQRVRIVDDHNPASKWQDFEAELQKAIVEEYAPLAGRNAQREGKLTQPTYLIPTVLPSSIVSDGVKKQTTKKDPGIGKIDLIPGYFEKEIKKLLGIDGLLLGPLTAPDSTQVRERDWLLATLGDAFLNPGERKDLVDRQAVADKQWKAAEKLYAGVKNNNDFREYKEQNQKWLDDAARVRAEGKGEKYVDIYKMVQWKLDEQLRTAADKMTKEGGELYFTVVMNGANYQDALDEIAHLVAIGNGVFIDAEKMERFGEAEVNAVAEAANAGRMPHVWVKTPANTPQNILTLMVQDHNIIPVGTPGTMPNAEEQAGNGIEIGLDSLPEGAKTAEVKSTLKDIIEKQVKGPAYIFLKPGVLEGQKVTDENSATYRIIQSGKELVGEVQGIVKDFVKTLNRPLTPKEMYENAYNGALVLEPLIRGIDAKSWSAVNGKLKGIDAAIERKGLRAAYDDAVKAISTLDENAKVRIGKALKELHAADPSSVNVDKAQLEAYKAELLGFVHSLRAIPLYNRYIASMNERAVPDNAEKMKRVRGLLLEADTQGVNVEEIQKQWELQDLKFADADIQALLDYVRGKTGKPQAALNKVEQKLKEKKLTPAEAMVYVKAIMKTKENESYKKVIDEIAAIVNPFINDIAARKTPLAQSPANQWAITEMLYLLDTIDNWKKLSVIDEVGPNMNMNTMMSMLGAA